MVQAGKYAVALVPVTPSQLGCVKTAQLVRYPVPCPVLLPPIVISIGGPLCLGTFMAPVAVGRCGGGPTVRRWMGATGGAVLPGPGLTPSNDEHFVMEALPFRTTNYEVVADGTLWGPHYGRPRDVRALGWVTIGGRRMRWIVVSQADPLNSFMSGHLMLVWATRSHTYTLGFHILWGMPMARAPDIAVASHLVMVGPGSHHRDPGRPNRISSSGRGRSDRSTWTNALGRSRVNPPVQR